MHNLTHRSNGSKKRLGRVIIDEGVTDENGILNLP
jgi:hypothetical protein